MAKRRRLSPAQAENTALIQPSEPKSLRPALATAAPPIAQIAGDASATAALHAVAQELESARREGRLVQRLPLTAIDAHYLVRDRLLRDDDEMTTLMDSIRQHGQRMAIEVTELAPGHYGLISGFRRLTALQQLFAATGEAQFGTIKALLRRPETAGDAYVAMVEENEIRLGLSYYERARIAAKAVESGVFDSDRQALQRLFGTASKARRSKIGTFMQIYRALDPVLRYPAALPERLGLLLARALQDTPDALPRLQADLRANPVSDAADEQRRLQTATAKQALTRRLDPVIAPEPTVEELHQGLFMQAGGAVASPIVVLSGPALTPALQRRLRAWLLQAI